MFVRPPNTKTPGSPTNNSVTRGGGRMSRIPAALQNVFLQSQAGEDVEKIAAPVRVGFRIFQRLDNRKNNNSSNSNNKKSKAPNVNSLYKERNGTKDTAATASRKAIKERVDSTSSLLVRVLQSWGHFLCVFMSTTCCWRRAYYGCVMCAVAHLLWFIPVDAGLMLYNLFFVAVSFRRCASLPGMHVQTVDRESPQAFLIREMEARGYSSKLYCSLEGGYYCRPTPLQQASYGSSLSKAIRASDGITVRKMMDAGLSPNPCNQFGESLVHMVCRRGDHKVLRILLEAGCSVQVTDDYGRTPLHDACWRADPSFDTVQLILDSDKHLVQMMDCRGTAPLAYVKPENYQKWTDFLESKLDRFWPKRDVKTEGEERPPPMVLRPPHSLPIPDPEHALPVEVAVMVANGQMSPEEAMFLDESSDSESDYSDEDSDYSGSDDGEEYDAEEMREICFRAGGPIAIARKCFGGDVKVVGGSFMKRA